MGGRANHDTNGATIQGLSMVGEVEVVAVGPPDDPPATIRPRPRASRDAPPCPGASIDGTQGMAGRACNVNTPAHQNGELFAGGADERGRTILSGADTSQGAKTKIALDSLPTRASASASASACNDTATIMSPLDTPVVHMRVLPDTVGMLEDAEEIGHLAVPTVEGVLLLLGLIPG